MDKNLLYIMYGNDPKSMVQKALDQTKDIVEFLLEDMD